MTTTTTAPEQTFEKYLLPEGDHKNSRLNTKFRCDCGGCGSQAYVEVTMAKNGHNLYFCVHHANELEDKLVLEASHWHDERNRLIENRHQGSEN